MFKKIILTLSVCVVCMFNIDAQKKTSQLLATNGLPLKPDHTISISTTEGSYMDVDISPDGKTILFNMLGDLFSVPVTGGKARQLTQGLALNYQPAWSPDGKLFAYISDATGWNRIHIRDLAGKFHEVIEENEGIERARGTRYNFAETGAEKLFICWTPDSKNVVTDQLYPLTGGHQSLFLKKNPSDKEFPFALDNGLLYYSERVTKFSKDGQSFYIVPDKVNKVYIYDLGSTNMRSTIILPHNGKNISNVLLSPDERYVSYMLDSNNRRSLCMLNREDDSERILLPSFQNAGLYTNNVLRYCFSPDSENIFLGYGGKIHRVNLSTGHNAVIPFKADVKVAMAPFNYNRFPVNIKDSFSIKYIRNAERSPDGKRLAFMALNKVYVMDLPAGRPRLIADQPLNQFQPHWSRDSKWLTYESWSDEKGGGVWKASGNEGVAKQLVSDTGQIMTHILSPDGTQLYYTARLKKKNSEDEENWVRFLRLNLLTGKNEYLANSIKLDNYLTNYLGFSHDDSELIYTSSNPRGYPEPYMITMQSVDDPKAQKKIADVSIRGTNHSGIGSLSPDGRYIAFNLNAEVYILPIERLNSLTDGKVMQLQLGFENSLVTKIARGIDPIWMNGGERLGWMNGNVFCSEDFSAIQKQLPDLKKHAGVKLNENIRVAPEINPSEKIAIHLRSKPAYGEGVIAFKHARIITMNQDIVIENGDVVIHNGRITSVGKAGKVSIPSAARVIDLQGKSIIPGLVDLHDHGLVRSYHKQQDPLSLGRLAFGITTARDPAPAKDFSIYGMPEIFHSGMSVGPRYYPAIRNNNVNSYELLLSNITEASQYGVSYVKQYRMQTRIGRQWAALAAKKTGLNLTNEGEASPLLNIMLMKDGSTGVEHNHNFQSSDLYHDTRTFLSKMKVYWSPTIQVSLPPLSSPIKSFAGKEFFGYYFKTDSGYFKVKKFAPPGPGLYYSVRYPKPTASDSSLFFEECRLIADLRHMGMNITMGSHGNWPGIGAHFEIWSFKMGGMTNLEALQSATILGAKALGIQKDLGSIERGKIADLIILDKNPLENIRNTTSIKYVMKSGILYDADTMNEVWPEIKPCPYRF